MNIFRDLKSIRTGEAKALRDIVAINAHNERHHEMHEADPNWDCEAFNDGFFSKLGDDINKMDDLEQAGYSRIAKAFKAKRDAEAFKAGVTQMIPIELSAEEYEAGPDEAFLARIKKIIEEDMAFRGIVADSDDDETEKGGK